MVDTATNTVRVALLGDIDLAVTDELRVATDEALEDRPDAVVLDFAGVTFMDSTGIRFIVGFKNRCDAIGATWSLTNVSPAVARLVSLSGLTEFLQ